MKARSCCCCCCNSILRNTRRCRRTQPLVAEQPTAATPRLQSTPTHAPLPSLPPHPHPLTPSPLPLTHRRQRSLACLRLLVELRTSRTRLEYDSNSGTILTEHGRRGGGTGVGWGGASRAREVGAGRGRGDSAFLSRQLFGSKWNKTFHDGFLVYPSTHKLDCFSVSLCFS